jgi:hypothetical protein
LAIDIPLIRQREAVGRQLRPKVRKALAGAQPKLAVLLDNAIETLQGPEGITGAPKGRKAMAGAHHSVHARTPGRRQPALHRRFRRQGGELSFGKLLGP